MRRQDIVALDKRRVWHPYTPMQQYIDGTEPLVIERAEGARLYDVDGRSYLDGNASWWVALLGHRHPRLAKVLHEQSERMCHVPLAGIAHEPAARLADELCAVAPSGLERVFFSDDGSTALEVAIKLALGLWHNEGRPDRRRFLALEGAFHGDTLGATALGGVEVFRRPFAGALCDCVHVPFPSSSSDGEAYARAFEALRRIVQHDADAIAAIVVEPLLQGAAGMRIYAPEYLRELRALSDRHEILLVFDEVFTGFGRTGTMWGCDRAEVSPDMMCLAKGLSGGILPMGATLASERVFEAFLGEPSRAFYYGHTYCGHPLGAAIAREVLAIYRDERILEQAAPKAARIAATFERLARIDGVRGWRALGMMGAIDLEGSGGYLARGGWRVYQEALARGAYLRPLGDTVYVAPALNIADDELDELLRVVEVSLRAALD
jgi:adenosylmethionine-8-amino-7-oxononanoate aminotransferase